MKRLFLVTVLLMGLVAACAPTQESTPTMPSAPLESVPVVPPQGQTPLPVQPSSPPLQPGGPLSGMPPGTPSSGLSGKPPTVTTSLPVYPGAEPSFVPTDLKRDWGISDDLMTNGFAVAVDGQEVLQWYRSRLSGWTLEHEETLPGRPGSDETLAFQKYRKADQGVFLFFAGKVMNGRSMLILAEGPWSLVEACASRVGPGGDQPGEPIRDTTPPVLKNLAVEFGRYDAATGRAGAFLFNKNQDKVFLEFGAEVSTGPDGGKKKLPSFTYRTAEEAKVYAVSDGYVTGVVSQPESNDYELFISPVEKNSAWFISYDHIKDVSLKVGDIVAAGQMLGTVARWENWGGVVGLLELTIGRSNDGRSATYYSPFKLFDPALIEEYKQKVSDLMSDWETFKGDPSIYDESKDIYPGSPYETLTD